ncbi:MAG: flagellar biosynthesis repressor FlbT [Paracoccus sp. (in: a-proteobacteria)]|nr:flagellar biosynthesis repressor FlbT [Paracoccus sp. (in: a-proteobacteria)]
MAGLVLKLAPNERILVNGTVIENGDRRAKILIRTPDARILRLRDAIHPDAATTPVARLCYQLQLIVSGDCAIEDGCREALRGIEQLSQIFEDRDSRRILNEATAALIESRAHRAMKLMRDLLPREARLLGLAAP